MIYYQLAYEKPTRHVLPIEMTLEHTADTPLRLHLPAWRPGRYEIGNFAKNIVAFEVLDGDGNPLAWRKISKDCWEVADARGEVRVRYAYYAHEMNAGSTWLDGEQLYVNFVNCMLYAENRLDEELEVRLLLNDAFEVVCGLDKKEPFVLSAPDFYRLADSPMMAATHFTHWQYDYAGSTFHIVIKGEHQLDEARVIRDFEAFTKVQVDAMGDFPCKDYYFLNQFLPYRSYHGVEHFNSTVITLGPSERMHEEAYYREFLGISSHELFHTWNIIRIRPAEMMPYDFSKENYFETGYVAEGVTTYYGDLFLRRSKVFDQAAYLYELNIYLRRHFEFTDAGTLSVADSSMDLWLDGYVPGVPFRKSSIYIKGALVTMLLDLMIRKASKNEQSFDDVMRIMWEEYGKKGKGYTPADYREACERVYGADLAAFWKAYVHGNDFEMPAIKAALADAGFEVKEGQHSSAAASRFGFLTEEKESNLVVSRIAAASAAEAALSVQDELVAINGRKVEAGNLDALIGDKDEISIHAFRQKKLITINLKADGMSYFTQYRVVPMKDAQPLVEGWI